MEKIEKKIKKVLVYLVIITIFTLPFLMYRIGSNLEKQNSSVRWLYQNTDWKRLPKIEGDYTAFLYDVINAFSSDSTHNSMRKEERIKYAQINFRLARAFNYGYFDIPIIHALESDFNPRKDHKMFKEIGIGGFWYGTAKYYHFLAKMYMPKELWRKAKFDFNRKTDLHDIENALKMTYIWVWIENCNYKEVETYVVSGYRWGRFLRPPEDDDLFPIEFNIKMSKTGITYTYNPIAYYFTWRKIKRSLEGGSIDTAKTIHKKWKDKRKKLIHREIEYRRAIKIIKRYQKEIKELKFRIDFLNKQYEVVDKVDKKQLRVLKQIGGEAKKQGWRPEIWNKFKKYIKEILKAKGVK